MNKRTLLFALLLITCLFLMLPELLSAQPSFPDDPDQIPVDGGLAVLLAAGSGYALKKFKEKKEANFPER